MARYEDLHLAIAFDERYQFPAYVLLTSLFHHVHDRRLVIHVIADGLAIGERTDLKKFGAEWGAEVLFYDVDASWLSDCSIRAGCHLSAATYYRLFFPWLLRGSVDRLVYLDSDTLVVNDPSELWDVDLGDYPAGAVQEINATKTRLDLGIDTPGTYFNAGVLVMDIPQWNAQRVSERAIEYIRSRSEQLRWADQDALNVVLKGNYLPMDARYNVVFQDVPSNLRKAECQRFVQDKVVIHFTLRHKPWSALCENRLKHVYEQYSQLSPKYFATSYSDWEYSLINLGRLVRIRGKELIDEWPAMSRFARASWSKLAAAMVQRHA